MYLRRIKELPQKLWLEERVIGYLLQSGCLLIAWVWCHNHLILFRKRGKWLVFHCELIHIPHFLVILRYFVLSLIVLVSVTNFLILTLPINTWISRFIPYCLSGTWNIIVSRNIKFVKSMVFTNIWEYCSSFIWFACLNSSQFVNMSFFNLI